MPNCNEPLGPDFVRVKVTPVGNLYLYTAQLGYPRDTSLPHDDDWLVGVAWVDIMGEHNQECALRTIVAHEPKLETCGWVVGYCSMAAHKEDIDG